MSGAPPVRSRETVDIDRPPQFVWYAAYGSNASPDRLACYLTGAKPPGSVTPPTAEPGMHRAAPQPGRGCRDPSAPRGSLGLVLPGLLYFTTESAIWTGGRAFYDPEPPAETPVHAYLLTRAQFSDIVAQEMQRPVGTDLDLTEALRTGRGHVGPGRYETLVCPGSWAGIPVMTCTSPWRWRDLPGRAPAAAYLRHIGHGLRDAHRWPIDTAAEYLASRPGAAGRWNPDAVTTLLETT